MDKTDVKTVAALCTIMLVAVTVFCYGYMNAQSSDGSDDIDLNNSHWYLLYVEIDDENDKYSTMSYHNNSDLANWDMDIYKCTNELFYGKLGGSDIVGTYTDGVILFDLENAMFMGNVDGTNLRLGCVYKTEAGGLVAAHMYFTKNPERSLDLSLTYVTMPMEGTWSLTYQPEGSDPMSDTLIVTKQTYSIYRGYTNNVYFKGISECSNDLARGLAVSEDDTKWIATVTKNYITISTLGSNECRIGTYTRGIDYTPIESVDLRGTVWDITQSFIMKSDGSNIKILESYRLTVTDQKDNLVSGIMEYGTKTEEFKIFFSSTTLTSHTDSILCQIRMTNIDARIIGFYDGDMIHISYISKDTSNDTFASVSTLYKHKEHTESVDGHWYASTKYTLDGDNNFTITNINSGLDTLGYNIDLLKSYGELEWVNFGGLHSATLIDNCISIDLMDNSIIRSRGWLNPDGNTGLIITIKSTPNGDGTYTNTIDNTIYSKTFGGISIQKTPDVNILGKWYSNDATVYDKNGNIYNMPQTIFTIDDYQQGMFTGHIEYLNKEYTMKGILCNMNQGVVGGWMVDNLGTTWYVELDDDCITVTALVYDSLIPETANDVCVLQVVSSRNNQSSKSIEKYDLNAETLKGNNIKILCEDGTYSESEGSINLNLKYSNNGIKCGTGSITYDGTTYSLKFLAHNTVSVNSEVSNYIFETNAFHDSTYKFGYLTETDNDMFLSIDYYKDGKQYTMCVHMEAES